MNSPEQAIVMTAGIGSRWLPLTKAMEKYMLPLGTRPMVDHVVEDVVTAGAQEVVFVVGQSSAQLRWYYKPNKGLEMELVRQGKAELAEAMAEPERRARYRFVAQRMGQYGTAAAVAAALDEITSERVLVTNSDDVIIEPGGALAGLRERVRDSGASHGLIGMRRAGDVSAYGVIIPDEARPDQLAGFVEKPAGQIGGIVNVGKYDFETAALREAIEAVMSQPTEAEYYLTDAINMMIEDGQPFALHVSEGEYYDCGTPASFLDANQRYAQQ